MSVKRVFVPFKYIPTFEVFALPDPALNFIFETTTLICMGRILVHCTRRLARRLRIRCWNYTCAPKQRC